jgi:hypothetical protein
VRKGFSDYGVRELQRKFLDKYPELDHLDVPLVRLDTVEWNNPITPIFEFV